MARGPDLSGFGSRGQDLSGYSRPTPQISARPRSLWERFESSADNVARTNPIISGLRAVVPGGYIEHQDPNTGETIRYPSLGQELRDDERERRDLYALRTQADPFYRAPGGLAGQTAAGAATLFGTLAGGAADPTSLIAPGRSIVGRAAGGATVNAGLDAVGQGGDVLAGIEDRYSLQQGLIAATVGGTLGAVEGVATRSPFLPERSPQARGRGTDPDATRRSLDDLMTAEDYYGRQGGADLSGYARPAAPAGVAPAAPPAPARSRPRPDAPAPIAAVIDRASAAYGVAPDYMLSLAARESSFNPSARADTSSATGLYQFTDSTWLNTLRRHGQSLGLPDIEARIEANPQAVLALRTDPDLSARAAALLTQDNANALRRVLGREPTHAELYSAHFLGEAGAVRLAQADPMDSAARLFPQAARANRGIFFDGQRPRTVGELRVQLSRGFGAGPGVSGRALGDVATLEPFGAEVPEIEVERLTQGAALIRPTPEGPISRARSFAPALPEAGSSPLGQPPAPPRLQPEAEPRLPDGFTPRMDEPLAPLDLETVRGLQVARRRARPQGASLFTAPRAAARAGGPDLSQYATPTPDSLFRQQGQFSPATAAMPPRPLSDSLGASMPLTRAPRASSAASAPDLSARGAPVAEALAAPSRLYAVGEGAPARSVRSPDLEPFTARPRVGVRLPEPGRPIDLGQAADRLYRSTGAEEAVSLLAGPAARGSPDGSDAFVRQYGRAREVVLTDTPARREFSEALNAPARGVMLEFDAAGVPGRVVAARPDGSGSDFAAAMDQPQAALRSIRVDRNIQSAPEVGARLAATLSDLEGQGWVRTETPEYVQLARPEVAETAVSREFRARAGGLDLARFGTPEKLAVRNTPQGALAVDLSNYGAAIGASRPVGGLREAPRPGAVAQGQGSAGYVGQTVSELARRLRVALGLTHRQGRVMRGAQGEYDTGSGVVRTKAVQELDVLAHEATHALEFKRNTPALQGALKAHAAELTPLAYPGAAPGVLRQEGFAEFGRWYLTNPDHARKVAPRFYDAFERALETDAPDALAEMRAIQDAYRTLLNTDSVEVAKSSIAYTGRKTPIGEVVRSFREDGVGATIRKAADAAYTWFVDDLHPLSRAVRSLQEIYAANTGQKLELKRANDPYALARLSREAYAAGHVDIMSGVVPYHGLDPEGPSLAQALETANIGWRNGKWDTGELKGFDAYLIARRMIHEWARYHRDDLPNPPDRNTLEFHQQVIRDSEARNPTWAEAAQQIYAWQNNLWKKEHEAGLITQESYQNGLSGHPDYVPFMRDMSDRAPGGRPGRPRGALQFAGGVKRFEGSTRDIISPLSSMMRRSYELNAIIKRNDVLKALDDLAEAAGPGAGAIVERLPRAQATAYKVDALEALRRATAEAGVSERDATTLIAAADTLLEGKGTATMFRQAEFSPRRNEQVVFVWRNGEKTPLLLPDGEFGRDIYTALLGMNRDLRNVVVDAMAGATQLLRYGVTLSPEFWSRNIIRDQLATWINTDVGFVPFLDAARGAVSELRQDGLAKRYAAAGGMRGGANVAATRNPFPANDAEAMAQLQHLRAKGWRVRRFASWRGLAEFTDLSETASRLGVFKKAFDQARRRGLSEHEATIEAAYQSRDYLDFGRRGSRMVSAVRIVTFLNAQVQSLDKAGRVLSAGGRLRQLLAPFGKGAPRTDAERHALAHAYKAWAKVSAIGAMGLALRALYADDPEYEEINDTLRATHWAVKWNGSWVFIPKPFELATLSNMLERGYEGMVLNDPRALERFWRDMGETIIPPHEIPALTVPFQLARNRDHLGAPIVPDHLAGTVDPQLQFNAYTSDFGKLLGRLIGVSPAQVDHVITGFGGTLGRYALQGSNMAGEAITGRPSTAAHAEDMFLSRGFVRRVTRGANSQAEFWDQVSRDGGEMVRALGSFRLIAGEGRDAEAIAYLNRLPPEQRAYVVATYFTQDGSQRLHPMVRAQQSVGIISDIRRQARDGSLLQNSGASVPLSPEQRRLVDNALADLALVEMRNALVATGVRGWRDRAPLDRGQVLARLERASPEAAAQLRQALILNRVPEESAVMQLWPTLRQRYEQPFDAERGPARLQLRRFQGNLAQRAQEIQRMRSQQRVGAPR